MKNLTFTSDQIYNIYKLCYSVAESKGKIKQNTLNQIVINSLKNNPDYDNCIFKTEIRIPGNEIYWGKYFTVDICVYKDDELIEVILNKAPTSNIKQNHVNSLNSKYGELGKLLKLNNIKVTMVNFEPKITPFFQRNEKIKNFENNDVYFLTTCGILDDANYKFDIDKIEECEDKISVKKLFIDNNPIKNIIVEEKNYTIT